MVVERGRGSEKRTGTDSENYYLRNSFGLREMELEISKSLGFGGLALAFQIQSRAKAVMKPS
jgi:hypothetical protein